MAGGRVCKVVKCGGEDVIVCAAPWLWNGGNNWACTFGKHVMRGTNGMEPYTVYPLNNNTRSLRTGDVVDEDKVIDDDLTSFSQTQPENTVLIVGLVIFFSLVIAFLIYLFNSK